MAIATGTIAAMAMMFTSSASAEDILIVGTLTGDNLERPGSIGVDVLTKKNGRPKVLTFIDIDIREYCRKEGYEPYILGLSTTMPWAYTEKVGKKYTFHTDEGEYSSLTGTISKNGHRLRGTAEFHEVRDDGYSCDTVAQAKAFWKW